MEIAIAIYVVIAVAVTVWCYTHAGKDNPSW